MVISQSDEIVQLSKENKQVKAERDEANSSIKVLRIQAEEANEDLTKVKKELSNSEARIKALQDDITNLVRDLSEMTHMFQTKEIEYENLTKELRKLIEDLYMRLQTSEATNHSLRENIEDYLAEIERLRRKLASDTRFRQFVAVKREVNELKDQKDELLIRVTAHEIDTPIPVMKRSGRVTTAGSRVKSAGCIRATEQSLEAKLSRPKSAKTLRALSEDVFS